MTSSGKSDDMSIQDAVAMLVAAAAECRRLGAAVQVATSGGKIGILVQGWEVRDGVVVATAAEE